MQECSLFSTLSPEFIVCRFFYDGHSDWCEVISHCSFDLHFSNNEPEDEMVGWHHRLHGHGCGWTPGVGDRQGGLECFRSWDHKEPDMSEQLN